VDERLEALERSAQELLAGQREVRKDVRCIVNTWGEFQSTYGEYLKIALRREKDRAELRKAIIEKTLVAAIFALFVFVATASWHEIQSYSQTIGKK